MNDLQALPLKNFTGVANGYEKMLVEMEDTRKTGKVIGGHYPSTDPGPTFRAYAAGGLELRLTDKGLVDATNFTFLPVVEGPA
ncbi:MAG: hypothetical protein ABSA23_15745 [Anaerolineales bacterium]|jgi:adenine deaminase